MRTPFPQTRLLPLFLLVLLTLTSPSHAKKWYEVHFATIPHPEPVQFFFDFSGQMVIPKLVSPGAYYVFPGMQPRYPGGGIYQNVLDGRSGTWYFASGPCCFKELRWGNGFNVYAGETVTFDNKWDHPGDPHTGWTTTITHDSTGTKRRNSWPIGDRFWNQAVFAIEVSGKAWDFGPLEFRNVVITHTTETDPGTVSAQGERIGVGVDVWVGAEGWMGWMDGWMDRGGDGVGLDRAGPDEGELGHPPPQVISVRCGEEPTG
ncbi:uncharacterized protein IWZ02DRAFT_434930 [Phyllosticta citriasiana]|uniref:uncharacterized protein n=1 Tax=Phyllosticta citriasiana TaxID=595635 RepID=UPI0030FD6E22